MEQDHSQSAELRNCQLFSAAVETANLSVWEYDIPTHRILLSGALPADSTRLFTGRGAIVDLPAELARLLDGDGAAAFLDVLQAVAGGAPSASCECWYRQQPGRSPRCERLSCTTVYGADGKPVLAHGVGQDITAQKLAERRYRNLSRQLLQINPYSLGTFRLNLTTNTCSDGQSPYPRVLALQEEGTADGYLRANAANIADERIRQNYLTRFTCENLLAEFRSGRTELSIEYPSLAQDGETIWVGGYLSMAQNPANGNVEAVVYAINITERKIEQSIVTRIAEENFDHIGLIYPSSQTFELRKQNQRFPAVFLNQKVDYPSLLRRIVQDVVPEDRDMALRCASLEQLTAVMYEKGTFSFSFRVYDPDNGIRRKKSQYSWLDSTKTAIIVMQSDVTVLYAQEQARQRREQDAQLAAEELKSLEATLGGIPAGLAVYHRQGAKTTILTVNEFLCRLVRTSRTAILSGDYDEIVRNGVHPEDLAQAIESMDAIFSEGSASFTYRCKIPDGGYLWISAVGQSAAEKDGSRLAYVLYQDATEQKLREAEFDRKIHELSAVNPNTVGLFHLNLTRDLLVQGQIFWPGGELLESERTASGLIRRVSASLHREPDRSRFTARISLEKLLDAYQRGSSSLNIELRVPYGETSEFRWVTSYITLAKNPRTGDVEAIVCTLDTHEAILSRDIIARITGEDYDFFSILDVRRRTTRFLNIRESERETVPITTGRYDEDIQHAAELFSAPTERADILHRLSFDTVLDELSRQDVYYCAYSLHLPDGRMFRKRMKYVWLDDSHDTILSTRVDITDAYQQEQAQLQQMAAALHAAESANEAKTEFLSRISHDIRTPISIISAMTRFAWEDINSRERLLDDLGKIETSNKFLLSLINDVLDISKIDSGKIELNPEPYPYAEYTASIRNMLEPLCQSKGLFCSIETGPEIPPAILVDSVRLNQITFNLISNAVKYTPKGGHVQFSAFGREAGGGMVDCGFTVRDTGIGMSEEFQQQMFEPFTQEFSNPNHPKAETGTGLGLSIVYRLTKLMGGTITVKSALGAGTEITVAFRFPKAQSVPAETAEARPKPLSGHVLVAEDNAMNAEIASRVLQSFGLRVECVENGRLALDRFSAAPAGTYQVLLLDIQMPVLNGYETAEAIRALPRPDAGTVPIVAMTADAFTAAREKCLSVGMNDYLTKPLDPARLYAVLSGCLPASGSSKS